MKRIFIGIFCVLLITGCNSPVVLNKKNLVLDNNQSPPRAGRPLAETHYQNSSLGDPSLYDRFFQQTKVVSDIGVVRGGIVPHHLLAGYIPASFFSYIGRQKPSTIVLFSPNHFRRGPGKIISGLMNWQTPYGAVSVDQDIISKLGASGIVRLDDKTMALEHGIFGLMPMIAKTNPQAKIVPIIMDWSASTSSLDAMFEKLVNILPADAVVVASVDFSHYQTLSVANFHDEYTRAVIRNFDFDHIWDTEIDSHPSVYMLMRFMDKFGSTKIAHEISDNSVRITGRLNAPETTSYFSPWFVASDLPHPNPLPSAGSGQSLVKEREASPASPSFQEGVQGGVAEVGKTTKTASLLFFGDMMLDRNVKKRIDTNGADWIFSKLAGEENRFFMGTNVVHANLEGPFSDSRRATTKEIAFRFDPLLIPVLKKFNFNIFTVANNHSLDMGAAGLKESAKNLSRAGIDFYGDGYGIGDNAINVRMVGGMKIAFVGFNDTYFRLDNKKIEATIKNALVQSDLVIANIHWGDEYQEISNARQRELAHIIIDAGADIIIGHHPHVVQEMEIYNDKPIFYSLGNFVFDQYFSVPTQQGLAVGVICHCEAERSDNEAIPAESKNCASKSLSLYVFPLKSINSQPQQMDYEEGKKYFAKWLAKSRLNGYNFNNTNNLVLIK